MKRFIYLSFPFILTMNLVFVALLVVVYYEIDTLNQNYSEFYSARDLSEELKYSSDELTRVARSYAVTGDQSYRTDFQRILDVRNGIAPRSSDTLIAPNQKVPLRELIKGVHPTEAEFQHLKQSENFSNDLVNLETEAFNAMKGFFKDSKGQYSIKAKSNQALAVDLLYGKQYHLSKTKIMEPIYQFQRDIHSRMAQKISRTEEHAKRTLLYFISVLIVSVIFTCMSFSILRRLFMENQDYQKNLETMVEKRTSEAEESRHQMLAQEKLASLGVLAAGIAHELKNPLNIIINAARLNEHLLSAVIIPEVKDSNTFTRENTETIVSTAEQVIQMSKIITTNSERADSIVKSILYQSSSGKPTLKTMDFGKLVQNSFDLAHHSMCATKRIEYNFVNNIQDVGMIPSYEEFSRAVINLVDNSFDALIEKNKIAGPTFKPQLELSCYKERGFVKLRIKDNGTGIPKEIRQRILEPFFTTKSSGGTGLGLAISFDIIKMHQGILKIDSVLGEYTEFCIVFPDNLKENPSEREVEYESKFTKHSIR